MNDITPKEAIANLNHLYGMVAPDIQRSLDVAIKALERPQGDCISREGIRKALNEAFDCEDATKYGNKNAEQQSKSYSTLMLYEIANIVEDCCDNAPTVEPRVEYGTDGQPYKLSMTNGKEYARQKGEWVYHDKLNMYFCKDCGLLEPFTKEEIEEGVKLPNFCQQCGADMRKGGAE